jgi:hypothetical protein
VFPENFFYQRLHVLGVAVSMVESAAGVPFDLSQLVSSGVATTISLDDQQFAAIKSETGTTFTLTSSASDAVTK